MNRIFVEKQAVHAQEARHLLHDLRESLGLPGLTAVRVIQRYDVGGLSEAEFRAAVAGILSEPQVDEVFDRLETAENQHAFAVEYLPGQFDQRADSAAQCIQILTGRERPEVRSAKVIVLEGRLDAGEVAAVKGYVINAVDSHEVPLDAAGEAPAPPVPGDVEVLDGFTAADPAGLRATLGLAMSAEDVAFTQAYFRDQERREPTITEIRVLDTYWSDHCRHTTFLTRIDEVAFDDEDGPVGRAWRSYLATREALGRGDRPVTLMDLALTGMRELRASGELDNLEESDEVNAASIVVPVEISRPAAGGGAPVTTTEEWLVMFKNETHNHPTEIEPYGGAATCIGGCIRDPLSGRAYVYQAMRVTGAADPRTPFADTLPGKLPQKKICQVAAHGYSSYGNQIGLATGQVAEVYHPGYVAKRMEIGAVVAAAPRSQVVRGTPAAGDVILLIGGRTGRDGVGGATGSSKEHTETALQNSAEVQKGDAPTERKIQRLFRNAALTRRIKVCNDFGAGGVSVAIGEIAPSLEIDLDAVPKKYDGLDGTELAISESQERMAVCVDRADIEVFIREADRENLECVHVADVTDSGRLVMRWRGRRIVDLSREFLDTNGVQQSMRVQVAAGAVPAPTAAARPLPEALRDLNLCSQRGLGERFDGSVGAGTVLWPFGGGRQITPPDAMVAKLPLLEGDTDACTFMAWGFDPVLSAASPFHGAAHAVTESVCRAVAAGARLGDIRLTLQEYFPKPGNDPRRWGLPLAALLGAYHAQHGLRLAAIGGKDSMSGTFNDLDVPPTLVSFAVAPGRAGLALSPEFKRAGTTISLVDCPPDADGLPDYAALRRTADALHRLNASGALLSLHHAGTGGLGVALARMAFGNHLGFAAAESAASQDFRAPRPGGFLIEHETDQADAIRAALPGVVELGRTTTAAELVLPGERHALDALRLAWESTLEPIYPTRPEADACGEAALPAVAGVASPPARRSSRPATAKPKVLIPSFPGTNSEYDSAKAFREAGGDASILVFRNLTAAHLEQSLTELAARIRESHILMFPGGFSAGDEPDGSAKFIATVIRNPRVADAIMDLITHRDGLVLGICNGFQALIKTGLVPYGRILGAVDDAACDEAVPPPARRPTLVHNTIGRHVSRYVHTRVESRLSPWLARCEVGEIHNVPVSHGEGRFFASAGVLAGLAADGRIATRYCDVSGAPSMDPAFNPNGSLGAVEGLTSPCGRVFGKMAHSERAGRGVARNLPGNKQQPLFAAGVEYFA